MKKEIIFCTDSLNIGGIELALIRLLKGLVKTQKYNIKLCIKDDEKLQLISEIPKEIEYVILSKSEDKKYVFRFIKKIIEKKRFFNFIKHSDVLIDYYDGNWFKIFSKIKQQKKIVCFHTILEKLHIFKNIDVVKDVYDKYIVLTEEVKKELLEIGIEEKKIQKLYNIIPTEEILKKSKDDFQVEEDYFVMIGRLVNDSKDYNTVIEAFKDKNIEEKLYIVGDGPYKKELEEKVKKLNLESKIKFLGSKKNPYPILNKSKGLILSSHYEGLSNVILEALVLKKNIIASDCPYGPKEILGEKSELGILFPIGNVEELVSIIKKIKFKKFSSEKIDKKIIEFSEKEIINKWNNIL